MINNNENKQHYGFRRHWSFVMCGVRSLHSCQIRTMEKRDGKEVFGGIEKNGENKID